MENLVGGAPEISVRINDVYVKALVDSGSQISTMSLSCYKENFSASKLEDCLGVFKIEGVSGESVPYCGFFLCSVSVSLPKMFSKEIPVFVVRDTSYNSKVPVLLGTNFLQLLLDEPSLDIGELPSALKIAVIALEMNIRHLQRSHGVYGHIVAADDLRVPAHSSVLVMGRSTVVIPVRQQMALVQQSIDELPVTPGLVNVSQGHDDIPVEIVNCSSKVLHVTKGQEMARLHQVSVEIPETSEDEEFLQSFTYSHLDSGDTQRLEAFLLANRDLFAMNTSEMGCTNVVTHKMELDDETPFKEKFRPIPPGSYQEVRQHIAELLSAGVVKESKSPFASNMVLVRKKDGSLRLCVDYRKLNAHTKKDAYSIPRIDTLIDSLKGATYFASLDLFAGYHQVQVDENHQERTAFSAGALGFYEYVKMPFGLCNAPSTFQRMMEKVLEGLTMQTCAVYLDDVIVYVATKDELFERLNTIFSRFREANLRLKPSKCHFFQQSVEFLGLEVSEFGVQCCKKHLDAVLNWPRPSNTKELRVFLGFVNFYRKFIPGYASIAEPLYLLLKGRPNSKSCKKPCKKEEVVEWKWAKAQEAAFSKLKDLLTSPPILSYPDFEKAFVLHVDASSHGLGAVLYQRNGKKLEVLAYASKSLSGPERNYSAHKLEFLGMKWAITVKFRHYLYGKPLTVFTDHNPLAYVNSTAKLDAVGHRWLADLSDFQFEIFYKPGKLNRDADGLSRRPNPELEQAECTQTISHEVFKELCSIVTNVEEFAGVAESVPVDSTVLVNSVTVQPGYSVDWAREQRRDPDLARVVKLVESGNRPTKRVRRKEPLNVTRLLSLWSSLSVEAGKLFKATHSGSEVVKRLVVPAHRRKEVLRMSHDELGHLGRDKTISVAKDRFFWPGLTKDVEDYLKSCPRCLRAKAPHLPERAPLHSIVTTRPLELVCMDFVSLETSAGGYKHILVVTDHFTKYACAYPTRSQHASVVAKILVEQFVVHYGIPERLHSDQGANFEGRVIRNLCNLLGMKKSRTSPYHPQGDGITERFNRTLLSMLSTMELDKKTNWKEHVAPLVHAYNCMRHETTGHTPFFLMFGRVPRLPVDMFLGLTTDYNTSVSSIQERLEAAYKSANEAAKLAMKHQAKGYNTKIRGHKLNKGDFVLVKNVGLKGKHKLADKWKSERYVVIDQPNRDIPVYKVATDGGVTKVLHRNMLLPLTLPVEDEVVYQSSRRSQGVDCKEGTDMDDSMLESSDSDFEMWVTEHNGSGGSADGETLGMSNRVVSVESPRRSVHSAHEFQDEMFSPVVDVFQDTVNRSSSIPLEQEQRLSVDSPVNHEAANEVRDAPVQVPYPDVEEDAGEQQEYWPSGRPKRKTRVPDYLSRNYVLNSQRVVIPDWRDRVSILLLLAGVFPSQSERICNTILEVIS